MIEVRVSFFLFLAAPPLRPYVHHNWGGVFLFKASRASFVPSQFGLALAFRCEAADLPRVLRLEWCLEAQEA